MDQSLNYGGRNLYDKILFDFQKFLVWQAMIGERHLKVQYVGFNDGEIVNVVISLNCCVFFICGISRSVDCKVYAGLFIFKSTTPFEY